jgi:predicted lysophospholipase L1 biosynthesis ABC-type transport system permease subunit
VAAADWGTEGGGKSGLSSLFELVSIKCSDILYLPYSHIALQIWNVLPLATNTTRQSFCINSPKQGEDEILQSIPLAAITLTLSSCDVIGGIFKAGFWTAIILIALVVGLILWLLRRRR